MKKKANRKATTAAKKAKKKKSSPKRKKERNPAGVRNDIARIVESGARKITRAVMDQAMTGQLAPAKYLFEMASIFPEGAGGSQATTDEDCLAKTLLRRMNLPEEPIARDEEDAPKVAIAAVKPSMPPSEDEEKDAGSDPEDESDVKKPTLM